MKKIFIFFTVLDSFTNPQSIKDSVVKNTQDSISIENLDDSDDQWNKLMDLFSKCNDCQDQFKINEKVLRQDVKKLDKIIDDIQNLKFEDDVEILKLKKSADYLSNQYTKQLTLIQSVKKMIVKYHNFSKATLLRLNKLKKSGDLKKDKLHKAVQLILINKNKRQGV